MRQVVENSEVPKLWWSGKQGSARNKNNTFYFVNSTIFSYGRHFPIAVKLDNAVLFNTQNWSRATNRHKALVKKTIPSETAVFQIPAYVWSLNVESAKTLKEAVSLKDVASYYDKKITHYEEMYARSRTDYTQNWYKLCLKTLVREINLFLELYTGRAGQIPVIERKQAVQNIKDRKEHMAREMVINKMVGPTILEYPENIKGKVSLEVEKYELAQIF